jgi:Sec-independent protein translocase protein TatA
VSTHASAGDLGIARLVFGPKKLPELDKRIREAIRGIKSAMKEKKEEKAANGPIAAGEHS